MAGRVAPRAPFVKSGEQAARADRRALPRTILRLFATGVLCLGAFASCSSLQAAAPVLDHLFPAAVQAGTTNTVTAVGKFDPWPPELWVDAPGIVFKPETNNGIFSVEVAADAPAGAHPVRAYNEQGASPLRFIIITKEPQLPEVEPNDEFRHPQKIVTSPAWINGRLEKSGDVDSYGVALKAGQTLIASLEAYVLASPVDAVLRVVDGRGVERAWNHDGGPTLDPFVTWTADADGEYVVQVFGFAYPAEASVKFVGSAKCVYRLMLSRGAYVNYSLPLGVRRGVPTALELHGWNLPEMPSLVYDDNSKGDEAEARVSRNDFENVLSVAIDEGPELLEQERVDSIVATNRYSPPFAVSGRIGAVGELDRYWFRASKDEKWLIHVDSVTLGFPLDAMVRVENSKGKELAKNEGSTGVDPSLEWTAPEDGEFAVVVGNRLQRGGNDYRYHLRMEPARPRLQATLPDSALAVSVEKASELKVALKRFHGFTGELKVSAAGLPAGVSVEPVSVPVKSAEAELKFVTSAEAKPWNGPVRILVSGTNVSSQPALFELTSASENNGVPGGFQKLVVETTDKLWLTVLPAPKPAPAPSTKAEEKK